MLSWFWKQAVNWGLVRPFSLSIFFYLIEFFDELVFAAQIVLLPVLRADLSLSYTQIGLLMGLPHLFAAALEPALLLLGDTHWRRRLILGGGVAMALALLLLAGGSSFWLVLAALLCLYPASGAFVSLSQATLMDLNPEREDSAMARWDAAGSVGNLLGPLLASSLLTLSLGRQGVYLLLAVLPLGLVWSLSRRSFPRRVKTHPSGQFKEIFSNLKLALRNRSLLRWVVLLEFSDLMMDVFLAYVPLYFTDVLKTSPVQAGFALTVLMVANLAADLVAIPLLERFPGRTVVRLTAVATLFLFPAWLLTPSFALKWGLLVVLRFCTLGWYAVLQGRAYAAAPGQSATVAAINSTASILGGALAALVGLAAAELGLAQALWLLLLGPLMLILFV